MIAARLLVDGTRAGPAGPGGLRSRGLPRGPLSSYRIPADGTDSGPGLPPCRAGGAWWSRSPSRRICLYRYTRDSIVTGNAQDRNVTFVLFCGRSPGWPRIVATGCVTGE